MLRLDLEALYGLILERWWQEEEGGQTCMHEPTTRGVQEEVPASSAACVVRGMTHMLPILSSSCLPHTSPLSLTLPSSLHTIVKYKLRKESHTWATILKSLQQIDSKATTTNYESLITPRMDITNPRMESNSISIKLGTPPNNNNSFNNINPEQQQQGRVVFSLSTGCESDSQYPHIHSLPHLHSLTSASSSNPYSMRSLSDLLISQQTLDFPLYPDT